MIKQLAVVLLGLLILPATLKADTKEWTLLVYLNGQNSLDTYGDLDINEMEQIGSSNDVNVVVQRASMRFNTTRLLVKKDSNTKTITSPVVQDLGKQVDMGDANTLVDFIKWGVANYPAKHYFIDIWNHGAGWHREQINPRDISFDDVYNSHITTVQLGQAMAQAAQIIGHKVDIYGSDACLMAMPEVAGEMIGSVEVFAGSEETEPGPGWAYDSLLQAWEAKPTMTALEVGKVLSDTYVASYEGGSQGSSSATFSVFDMSMMTQLQANIAALAQSVLALNASDAAKIVKAAQNAQAFYYADYKDLGDFLKQLQTAKIGGIRNQILSDISTTMSQMVVSNNFTTDFKGANGVSFWFPTPYFDSSENYDYTDNKATYGTLEFAKVTHWDAALAHLFPQP